VWSVVDRLREEPLNWVDARVKAIWRAYSLRIPVCLTIAAYRVRISAMRAVIAGPARGERTMSKDCIRSW